MPISTTAFLGRRSLGLLRYCFPHGPIRIKNIFHDTEGNLQDHEYFDWHVIQQASKEEPRVQFTRDKVVFVRSDPRHEQANPDASELIHVGSRNYGVLFPDILAASFRTSDALSSSR